MPTRSLLLLTGFLRNGRMFPAAARVRDADVGRSLRLLEDAVGEQEDAVFGHDYGRAPFQFEDEGPRVAVFAAWSGEILPRGTRVGEVPDPGVVLCLGYEDERSRAQLPPEVFAQTLRRYALREAALKQRFDEHVEEAGVYVPPWLSPEVRRQRSEAAFEAAMQTARDQGFAHAVPLLEGVRGDCFPRAQVAIAVYEQRELGDRAAAMRRLGEVLRVMPRNVAARMQRASLLASDPGRRVEAAADWLSVLREAARDDEAHHVPTEVRAAATEGLWQLASEFGNPAKLEAAVALAAQDAERGFEVLSRYVHTHPCAWDAHLHLAVLALRQNNHDLVVKLLGGVRWLFPHDANPHFVYAQALVMTADHRRGLAALEQARKIAPGDPQVEDWLRYALDRSEAKAQPEGVPVLAHVARNLLVVLGTVRGWEVEPEAKRLPKVPGDMSILYVVQAIASHEYLRTGRLEFRVGDAEVSLEAMAERTLLFDLAGQPLSLDQTVGDVPDPGVVLALVYGDAERTSDGRLLFDPPRDEAKERLLQAARQVPEIVWRLDRHLQSPDATMQQRLDLAGY